MSFTEFIYKAGLLKYLTLRVVMSTVLVFAFIHGVQGANVTISGTPGTTITVNGQDYTFDLESTLSVADIEGNMVVVRTFGQDLNSKVFVINGHSYDIYGYAIVSGYQQALPIFKAMPSDEDAIAYGIMVGSVDICIGSEDGGMGWYHNNAYDPGT